MRRFAVVVMVAALGALAAVPAVASAAFGIESVETSLQNSAGEPELRAGAHPDFTVGLTLNTEPEPNKSGGKTPEGNVRDVRVTLPPGLIGNPAATPKCSQADLVVRIYEANCSPKAQVGIATILFEGSPTPVPLYNMEPPPGVAGQFAFNFVNVLVFVNATVTAEGGYRLRANVSDVSQGIPLTGTTFEFWGVPGSPLHDGERTFKEGEGTTGDPAQVPLFSNPTSCPGTPLRTEFRADSWQAPTTFEDRASQTDPLGNPLTISGCGEVPFEASIRAATTTAQADSPTGLDVDVSTAQNSFPQGLADSALRDAVLTLPPGMAVNPSVAGGLAACSQAQIGIGTDAQPSCPDSSKIGSLTLRTPLLEDPIQGSVYVAQQRQNQFGSLLALYLVVNDPERGVLVKIPGEVEPDPATGRLVARFADTPQIPFEDLHVSLFGGPRAALVTPPTCGTYETVGEFAPWSGGAAVRGVDSFRITSGPDGGPCPSGRFDPSFEGGTASSTAGRFSPFELQVGRGDGSQRLGTIGVRLPQGLLARLAGIPYCPDAALAAVPTAEGTGAAQLASPSCPAASRVGSVAVAAGAGSNPLWVDTGSAYLAGPYKGAPLSLAILTPALAGPFDLGNVVVRVALAVNPVTTQVTATSDPLPTILGGIPLDLRSVRVSLDRPRFTLNPTSCSEQQVEGTLVSTGGAIASPSQEFQASSCAYLGFSPRLSLALKGGTQRSDSPALIAKLTPRPGQANFRRVSVGLPHSEFLAQEHIKTICTRVQFAAEQCPQASIYGYAEAKTPLLGKPLRGPVYLRSSNHKLPDLVAALRGQIEVDLAGRIDSHNRGIRATFEGIPDAPISSFTLRMRGGDKSLLVNSTSLCGIPQRAQVRLLGQNGDRVANSPPLKVPCGGPKKK